MKCAAYYENKILTIPNLLSFFRLGLIPVIVWLYCFEEKFGAAAIVIIVSGMTDIVDGFIARRFQMISKFGKFLDPFADKMTQMALMACLSYRYPYMLIPVILLFMKELISFLSAYFAYRKSGVVMSSQWHGKITTVCLYTMIFIHVVWAHIPESISKIMTLVCTIMIFASFIAYEIQHLRRIFSKK